MSDFNMPIIELKLRYMSEQIHHAFVMHQNELSEHIKKSIDALMTDANIQKEVDKLCYDCMQECIKEVFNSAEVKRDLVKIMTEQVLARLNKTEPVSFSGSASSTTLAGTDASSFDENNFWESTKHERDSNAEG